MPPIAITLYAARELANDQPASALRTAPGQSVGEVTSAAGLVVVNEIGGARIDTSSSQSPATMPKAQAANRADLRALGALSRRQRRGALIVAK